MKLNTKRIYIFSILIGVMLLLFVFATIYKHSNQGNGEANSVYSGSSPVSTENGSSTTKEGQSAGTQLQPGNTTGGQTGNTSTNTTNGTTQNNSSQGTSQNGASTSNTSTQQSTGGTSETNGGSAGTSAQNSQSGNSQNGVNTSTGGSTGTGSTGL